MALFSFNGCDDGKVSSSVPSTPAQHSLSRLRIPMDGDASRLSPCRLSALSRTYPDRTDSHECVQDGR